MKAGGKYFGGRQSGFGFADAHLGFQNQDAGCLHIGRHIQHGALERIGQKTESLPEGPVVHGRILPFPGKGQVQFVPGLVYALGIGGFLSQFIHRD